MKKLSLQWRITLMTALLICSTCMAMNWLIGCSGRHYMDSIGANLSTAIDPSEGAVEYFDPSREGLDPNLTIVIYGAQNSFTATNWYITAAVTLLGGHSGLFRQRPGAETSADLRGAGGKGTARQSGGHEDHRGGAAGIPAVQRLLQPDVGAAGRGLHSPTAIHRKRRP